MMNDSTRLPAKRSRAQLWVLLAVFFVPLAFSFALYFGMDGWRPAGSTNRGELIDPARPLPAVVLPQPDGTVTQPEFLTGKWSVVFIGDGSCDARCRQALIDTRQVRLALNKDISRVQRVFLYTGDCCDTAYFAAEHPDLVAASIDAPAAHDLLEALPAYGAVPPATAGRIYLVDPLGNLMMSYAADAPARGLLDDLKKLLRLSHIG